MIATSHLIAGSALGKKINRIIPAFFAAWILHYILDMVPHLDPINAIHAWNKVSWTIVIIDLIMATIVTLVLWFNDNFRFPSPLLLGALGGIAPDILDSQPFWDDIVGSLPVFEQLQDFHFWANNLPIHNFPMPQFAVLGIITQFITIGISLRILLRKQKPA